MGGPVQQVHALLSALTPVDAVERAHRADALAWLESTEDVYRRVAPVTPPKHLVSYVLLRDPADGAVHLVDHRKARLWLPAGGHVDPFEDPVATARRELREELGLDAVFDPAWGERPAFLTVTRTAGTQDVHTDVSLWFVLVADRATALTPDPREFVSTRWWTPPELAAADPTLFDPHLPRALAKLA